MASIQEVVIVSGLRTPIGGYGKALKKIQIDSLVGNLIDALLRKSNINNQYIDSLYLGHGYQNSFYPNTARCAILKSALPVTVPGVTIQRQCASGLEAINLAVKELQLNNASIIIAGGAESLSTVPYLLPADMRFSGFFAKYIKFGPRPIIFKLANDGLAPTKLVWDLKTVYMAGTAQRLMDTFNITRYQADEYALRSQVLALAAQKSLRFNQEIEPVLLPNRGFMLKDEHPRQTSLEKLSALKPVLKTQAITAGNSSGINDGACLVLLAQKTIANEMNLNILATYVDSCVVALDPYQMGLGPVFAIKKLLSKQNLNIADIDLWEINEAFAVQYLACEKLLNLDRSKVNVNGGAIALGHPIGMSGARLLLTLAIELKLKNLKYGVAALCVGGGMGIATLIKNPHFD